MATIRSTWGRFPKIAAVLAIHLAATISVQAFVPSRTTVRPVLRPHCPVASRHALTSSRHPTKALQLHAVSPLKLPSLDENNRKSLLSAASFVLLDIAFRRLFLRYKIAFPSSLGGCGFLLAALLALPSNSAGKIFEALKPGAALLAKWLPLFFVPSLVTLPLANSMGSTSELLKVAAVIVGGFFFTLLTTSWSVVGIRKILSGSSTTVTTAVIKATEEVLATPSAPKAFSDETFNAFVILTSWSGVAALAMGYPSPVSALFLLSATLASFVFGARLPKAFTKLVHPLITCSAFTWTAAAALAFFKRRSFRSMLQSYRTGSLSPMTTGPGDILLFLLGPAVVSLAISMYDRRKLMRENLAEVTTSVAVSTFGGLFGTALAVRLLEIGSPSLRLSLLSRNITSPLAMAIASILGADSSLAVSIVVVTGLIGANFGASILNAAKIDDPVARGLGMGAAAHGLGTAAFANEKDAFPFAAIGMALTASAATVAVSIPVLKRMILELALGW
jgi:putative effector of murein hydrolase